MPDSMNLSNPPMNEFKFRTPASMPVVSNAML
jgi:hypothetical protein